MHIDDEEFENCDGPYAGDAEGWDVSNSTGSGTFDMYSGTQQSVNTFFAQLETQTGMCEPLQLAADMGVKVPLAQKVPSWILGVSDSSPLELAQAYATFAARGLHCDPRPVTEVLDAQGQPLKEFSTECEQVMPGATADAVNDILRGVMEPGGFGQNIAIDKPSAGKTGTNQQNMSVWFAGYTPTLATVAMVAGANEFGEWVSLNGQTVGGSPIYEAFGSTVAGPIWGDAMAAVSAKLDYEDFQAPPGDEIAGVLSTVPDVSGQSVEAATSTLEAAGFSVADGGQVNSEVDKGLVAYTSPEGGTSLSSGDTVTLYASTGYVPPPPSTGGGGNGNGNGNGNGKGKGKGKARRQGQPLAQLAAYLRSDGTAVGATLDLGRDDAHHLAHRAHALVGRAGLGDGRRHEVGDLRVGERRREVLRDDLALGGLLGRHLLAAAVGEGGGRLAAPLRLGRQDTEDVVVGELAGLLAGDLGVGDGGQHHPQGRGAQLVARLHGGGEVGAETVLQSTHAAHCGSLSECPSSPFSGARWASARSPAPG